MKFPPIRRSRRFPRSLVPLVCLLLAVGGGARELRAVPPIAGGEPRRVAILGFVPAGERTGGGSAAAENLGAGVADLLEGELDRRGLAVCERRSIALVLSEHRLAAAGLTTTGAAEVIRRRLPAVGYLLRGNIEIPHEGAVALSITVVDTGSGEEVSTLREEGSEAALAVTVSALAAKVADKLGGLTGTARPHRSLPGFSTVPEVVLLYYRGLAEMLADRPEYGAVFFTEATRADPTFTVARRWKARAYERLGFPEFAAAARRPLAGNVPEASAAGGGGDGRRLVAVVASGPGVEAALAPFKERLPAAAPTLAVLNPGLIDALAAESDLRLGGLFEGDGGLRALQGIGVDAAVGLELVPAADGRSARLRATAVRAGTGEFLAREDAGGTTPADAAVLAERLAKALSGETVNAGTAPVAAPGAAPNAPRYRWPVSGNVGRDRLAQTLYHLVRCPRDRWAWASLARLYEGAAGSSPLDPDFVPLAWDRLGASVDPREPDAATWLSTALWGKRWFHPDPFHQPKPFAEEFAPLLRDYPDSLAADVIRFAVANEHLEARRFAPAAELLLPLADRLADRLPAEEFWGDALRASVLYDAALAAAETGRRAEAASLLGRAEESVRRTDQGKRPVELLRSSGWVHLNPGHSGGQLNYTAPRDTSNTPGWAGFEADRVALRARLEGGPTTPAAGTAFTWPGEEFARVEKSFGRERLQFQRELAAQMAEAADRDPAAFRAALERQPQGISKVHQLVSDLTMLARTDAERAAVPPLAARLGAPLAAPQQRELARAARDRAAEVEIIRREVAGESDPQRKMFLQADLLRLTEGSGAQVDFLSGELPRWLAGKRSEWEEETVTLPLALEVARVCERAGRWDRAAEVYAAVAARSGRMVSWCTATLHQAECERRRGDPVRAATLLRAVAEWSQGDNSPVRYGYFLLLPDNLYTMAVRRLGELRRAGIASPGRAAPEAAGPVPGDGPVALPASVPRDPALVAELEEMLYEDGLRHPRPPPSPGPHQVFVKRHGHAAVPALLDALARLPRPPSPEEVEADPEANWSITDLNRFMGLEWMLRQTATAAEMPHVLAAFRRFPGLAATAFRLAPSEAAAVFDQHVRETGGRLDNFAEVVTRYRLERYLDGLYEEVAGGDEGFSRCATLLNVMLNQHPDPAGETRLRDVLERGLEKRRLGRRWSGVDWASLQEVAGRRGVGQFIECILDHPSFSPSDRAGFLRPILALPPTPLPLDDDALLGLVEANRGRWRWEPADRKFHLPSNP